MENRGLYVSIKKFMKTKVPTVPINSTVAHAIAMLKKESRVCESIDYVYVVEKNNRLVGVFSIKDLFRFPPNTKINRFMMSKVISVSVSTDAEVIAHLALKNGIKSVPIVESGKLIGVIPPREILYILNMSLRKDIFRFAGIHHAHLEYENTLQVPIRKSIAHRIPWLLIGLVGIMLTAAFISLFEKILQQYLILAFFVPAIVYISSALGTQIQALYIRDLAIMREELNSKKYLMKQMSISFVMSLIISVTMFVIISLFWKQPNLSFVISLAAFLALLFTSLTAFLVTFTIKKLGYDPAFGSGPFATIISDATSIIIYFAVVSWLL